MTDNTTRMQDDLFSGPFIAEPLAHRSSDTSKAAAARIQPVSAKMQRRILDYIKSRGDDGATYDEVVSELGLEKPTVAGRLNDLKRAGLIADTGRRRPTRSGSSASVVTPTSHGWQA
jgi:CRP-like cAMP-binding protein